MSRLFAGMDIATTASLSEAFPSPSVKPWLRNACVVTDVGDSALIVGRRSGSPPGDPQALAEAWRKLIQAGPEVRRRLGMAARRRVQRHFALPVTVERYQAIYASMAAELLQRVPSPGLSQCAGRSASLGMFGSC